jgi:WhiB family transcriptional regulator, redox-sensing transcriptional regulator
VADVTRLPGALVDFWEWQLVAACRGMDVSIFFHPPEERNRARQERIAQAKAICNNCLAINECRAHALQVREPYGVWGGLSEDERANLLGLASLKYPAKAGTGWTARHHRPEATRRILTDDTDTRQHTQRSAGESHG